MLFWCYFIVYFDGIKITIGKKIFYSIIPINLSWIPFTVSFITKISKKKKKNE